jgi:hypothetical protein
MQKPYTKNLIPIRNEPEYDERDRNFSLQGGLAPLDLCIFCSTSK